MKVIAAQTPTIRGYKEMRRSPDAYRWSALRDKVPGCRIADLFVELLNKSGPHPPIRPSNLSDYVEENWISPGIRKKSNAVS